MSSLSLKIKQYLRLSCSTTTTHPLLRPCPHRSLSRQRRWDTLNSYTRHTRHVRWIDSRKEDVEADVYERGKKNATRRRHRGEGAAMSSVEWTSSILGICLGRLGGNFRPSECFTPFLGSEVTSICPLRFCSSLIDAVKSSSTSPE